MRQQLVERRVAELAAAQGGVIATAQLRDLGLTDSAIRRRVEAGRLHPLHRGAYAVGHTRIPALGRRMAAVFACGPGAVISHQTAADEWDLIRSASPKIHVSVPTAGGRGHVGLLIHRRPHLPAVSKTHRGPLPITTREQTLLDIAPKTTPNRLRKAIDQADQRRLLDHTTLTSLATSRQPGAKRLRQALQAPPVPTRSEFEDAFLDLCDAHGIPRPPLINHPVGPYVADFLWPDANLIVETDGFDDHGTRDAFKTDRRRDVYLFTSYGLVTPRFTNEDVTIDAAETAARVKAGLHPARTTGTRVVPPR